MYHTARTHWQLRLLNVSFVVLFLLAVGMLQWLASKYHLQFDWTQARRHSLAPASIAAAERLKQPLQITAFASQRAEIRRPIQEMINRYQKYKPNITLEFVDPDKAPERVRAAGAQYDGELVLEHEGAKESLTPAAFNEENFTNALTRLGHRGERWVIFLTGHGERRPDRQANFDLSTWAAQLQKRGFKTKTLSLGEHPQFPQNTNVLVIASPRTRLLSGEVKEIQNYINRGGNLLWLHESGSTLGLESVAENLGIEFQPGIIVDPVSAKITGNATALVVTKYIAHPVVRSFGENTVFPQTGAINLTAPEGWRASTLIDTPPSSWAETGPLQGEIQFDKGQDIRGPLNVAMGLTRTLDKREQRIIVFGGGDFLANSYIANGGNLDLGLSLINWLSQDDAYVNIPIKTARDRTLNLSHGSQIAIAVGFLIVLPLLMIASGVVIWLRRRKR